MPIHTRGQALVECALLLPFLTLLLATNTELLELGRKSLATHQGLRLAAFAMAGQPLFEATEGEHEMAFTKAAERVSAMTQRLTGEAIELGNHVGLVPVGPLATKAPSAALELGLSRPVSKGVEALGFNPKGLVVATRSHGDATAPALALLADPWRVTEGRAAMGGDRSHPMQRVLERLNQPVLGRRNKFEQVPIPGLGNWPPLIASQRSGRFPRNGPT